jgi:hypothetical protein
MRAAFYRPDAPDEVLATASWVGGAVVVEASDDALRSGLERSFRNVPVVTDDASYRRLGTCGEVVIAPGTLEWFRAAAHVRATAENQLSSRLEPGVAEGGFDPAAGYRSFSEAIERLSVPTRSDG